ncbi:MAG: helix-turn-helix domain-containing protein [Verrucomicrobia bacterium]|nr:helix-turn-helix domain-containing protein [Verrucomicrobiota bacterium]
MQAENQEPLENFAFRLCRAAEEIDLTQAEIASRLGVSPQRVGNWFQGRNFPRQRESLTLAKLLKVEPEWLLQGSGEKSSPAVGDAPGEYGDEVRTVPLISWAHAGAAANYEAMPKHWHGRVSTMSRDKRAFALVIEGDSMEPKFLPGDRVVCEPSNPPRNGHPVVVKYVDDAVQIRLYHKLPNGKIRLAPINPVYPAIEHEPSDFAWICPVAELNRAV